MLTQDALFQSGDAGYQWYRIPAMAVTTRGTVLAIAEARKNSRSDHGDIDLALRRSEDGGRTWSKIQIIADAGERTAGNPCLVVDEKTGVVHLLLCHDNKRVLIMQSEDDGKTWSDARDITKSALDPEWRWVGTGPGHGIQLKSGRLVVPCWADVKPKLGEIQLSYVIYSDDHGQSWKRSQALEADASDECQVVELSDGTLYLNARSRQQKRQRAYAFSGDGGETWSSVRYDPRLPELSCQGSVIRWTDTTRYRRHRVLLAAPASQEAREELTIRLSYNDCRTWPVAKVLCAGSAAYSDLAVTRDGALLCLYEAEDYRKVMLARFNLEWLTDGRDRLRSKPSK